MFTKMFATLIATFLVTVVLVVDPAFVIEADPPPFTFDEADMRVAAEGTWELSHDNRTYRFSLSHGGQVRRDDRTFHGMISAAEACANQRSFIRPAAACEVFSDLPLVGTLHADASKQITGGVHVLGYRFERGFLEVRIGDAIRIGAQITSLGVVESVSSTDHKPVTLKRIAPPSSVQ
jgi:hypothetical protein